jgi:hypothetical protein
VSVAVFAMLVGKPVTSVSMLPAPDDVPPMSARPESAGSNAIAPEPRKVAFVPSDGSSALRLNWKPVATTVTPKDTKSCGPRTSATVLPLVSVPIFTMLRKYAGASASV